MVVEVEHVDRVSDWPALEVVFLFADEAEALCVVGVWRVETLIDVAKKLPSKSTWGTRWEKSPGVDLGSENAVRHLVVVEEQCGLTRGFDFRSREWIVEVDIMVAGRYVAASVPIFVAPEAGAVVVQNSFWNFPVNSKR